MRGITDRLLQKNGGSLETAIEKLDSLGRQLEISQALREAGGDVQKALAKIFSRPRASTPLRALLRD